MIRDRDADVSAIMAHVGPTDFGAGEAFFGAGETIIHGIIIINDFVRESGEVEGLVQAGVGVAYLKKGLV